MTDNADKVEVEYSACNNLISVLMPTYNVEQYVDEAVRSILNQTYENFELIIVDDGSTDGTYKILEKLADEDSRIRLYKNEVNLKICKTLNRALAYAQGSYIARMDGDDICAPDRLEKLKKYLDSHADIALVGSYILSIDENGRLLSRKSFPRSPMFIQWVLSFQSCVLHIWMARKNIYDELAGYRDVPYVEDYDFLLRGKNKGLRYANIPEFVYSVRTRGGNTASSNGLRQYKAKAYVQKINNRKRPLQYSYQDYIRAISSTVVEETRFISSYNDLLIAIKGRDKKLKMVTKTIGAMVRCRYIFRHVIEAALVRIVCKVENMFIGKE